MKPLNYNRGQTVYKEGDLADFVYIVREGEFELIRNFQKDKRKDFIIMM